MSTTRDSILNELKRQLEIHKDEVARLGLSVCEKSVELSRDTWLIPIEICTPAVDSEDVMSLLRVIRRSLRNKTSSDVSVFIDAEEQRSAG